MNGSPSLRVEELESRDVPSIWGTPWPDGEHLTISFAPDGTTISGVPSNLGQLFQQLGPQSEYDALQAFQTWAAETNVNLGLTTDNGAAFGTGRPPQGDPQFGDVRIGGRPMASDVVAITSPYNPFDPYSGDVVINTALPFGPGGYDLSTVMLHEAGHAFGIGDNDDLSSVMYADYRGVETALAPEDVAAIQSLYGTPQPNHAGNNALATATPLPQNGQIAANLTAPTDVDYYAFTTGLLTTGVNVQLNAAGLSLLTADVEVLNSRGQVVASTLTTDPTNNDLTLSLNDVRGWQTYYVRVSAATDSVFGVGSYQLKVAQESLLSGVTGLVGSLLGPVLNDTLATATNLVGELLMGGAQTQYNVQSSFASSSDVDYYRLAVPTSQSDAPENLQVTVWGQNGAILNPWIDVENASGQSLTAQVFTANGNATILQVLGLQPGGIYYLRVDSDSGSTGTYNLEAAIASTTLQMPLLGAGSLTASAPENSGSFNLPVTAEVHLVVAATGASGSVALTVTDENDETVATITAAANRARSIDVLLPAGQYAVSVETVDGSSVSYRIGLLAMTDPVGAQPSDPTTTPEPTSPPPDPSDPSDPGSSSGTGDASPPPDPYAPPTDDDSDDCPTNSWEGASTDDAQPY